MAVGSIISGTGTAVLPDIGSLAYNGISFSSLHRSRVGARPVRDEAGRVTKVVELRLQVDGVVTLPSGAPTTQAAWDNILRRLSTQGGPLTYTGRGYQDLVINQGIGGVRDVAFGPKPEVLDFQPYGAGRSASLSWACAVTLTEIPPGGAASVGGGSTLKTGAPRAGPPTPALQMCYECSVTFDEDCYSGIQARGVLEVPLTRTPLESRLLPKTVDAWRAGWLDLQFDLTNFKVVRRSFDYSKDRRTIEWSYELKELPPMQLPPLCPSARGSMRVRPLKAGKGLLLKTTWLWQVTLSATYTVRRDAAKLYAARAFYALLWFRMHCASLDVWLEPGQKEEDFDDPTPAPQQPPVNTTTPFVLDFIIPGLAALKANAVVGGWAQQLYGNLFGAAAAKEKQLKKPRAILTSFEFDEGLYEDSRQMSFSATWTALLPLVAILKGTGCWRQPAQDADGNIWKTSVADIMGWKSWLQNHPDANADVVVDLGLTGGEPSLNPVLPETVGGP